ncbi:MAG: 50S ribosomal protein L11 methyltransferase [Lachnospiraceae bacterium]|nr:50S ribosomal protein L11 methyltransferase [Lachnospiraceae bacterium]
MKWTKLEIMTTTEASELISFYLEEQGIGGVMIEDNVPLTDEELSEMYVDIPLAKGADDGKATVSCFLDDSFDIDSVKAGIADELIRLKEFTDVGEGRIEISETEDKDWMNAWKDNFKPFRVADNMIIKPTWEEKPEDAKPDDIIIEIDPGAAFGTGSHETTRLCIGLLKKYLKPGDSLLDVGTGSGILAIAGVKLGASFAHGSDVDEVAVRAAEENALSNGLNSDWISFSHGNLLSVVDDSYSIEKNKKEVSCEESARRILLANGGYKYDVVVANILADVIIALSGAVAPFIKDGGTFIVSGILTERAGDVKKALKKNGFKVIDEEALGEWTAIACERA